MSGFALALSQMDTAKIAKGPDTEKHRKMEKIAQYATICNQVCVFQ